MTGAAPAAPLPGGRPKTRHGGTGASECFSLSEAGCGRAGHRLTGGRPRGRRLSKGSPFPHSSVQGLFGAAPPPLPRMRLRVRARRRPRARLGHRQRAPPPLQAAPERRLRVGRQELQAEQGAGAGGRHGQPPAGARLRQTFVPSRCSLRWVPWAHGGGDLLGTSRGLPRPRPCTRPAPNPPPLPPSPLPLRLGLGPGPGTARQYSPTGRWRHVVHALRFVVNASPIPPLLVSPPPLRLCPRGHALP